jgi:hemoglobin/transferrin/lactoferrin receptor protein
MTAFSVAVGAAVPYFSNIDSAQIWGGGVEALYDAERWIGQLAYSNVRSKDRATGLTLADTPAENVALTVGAKLPAQNLTAGWRRAHFSAITTSSTVTSAPSNDTQDMFLTWSQDKGALAGFEVNLMVENVWNAEYRNNLSLDNAPGRTAKLSISKSFTF